MPNNYDVAFRFVNDTQWTATLEAWGPDPGGRGNGVMLILRPRERVAFMQTANSSYYYCVRHHGIEAGFSYVKDSNDCFFTKRDQTQSEDFGGHANEYLGRYARDAPAQLRHYNAFANPSGWCHGEEISSSDPLH